MTSVDRIMMMSGKTQSHVFVRQGGGWPFCGFLVSMHKTDFAITVVCLCRLHSLHAYDSSVHKRSKLRKEGGRSDFRLVLSIDGDKERRGRGLEGWIDRGR